MFNNMDTTTSPYDKRKDMLYIQLQSKDYQEKTQKVHGKRNLALLTLKEQEQKQ